MATTAGEIGGRATQPGQLKACRRSASSFTRAISRREMRAFAGRLCSDGDPAEKSGSRHSQHRCSRFVAFRSPCVDPASQSLQLGLHAPARRSLDSDPTEEGCLGTSRRSTAMPPNHAIIDPPRNALARLLRSMPFKTATKPSSSLSSSPCEGTACRTNAAAAIIPTQAPSLKRSSPRSGRIEFKRTRPRWLPTRARVMGSLRSTPATGVASPKGAQ
jgi:hypothetical protein